MKPVVLIFSLLACAAAALAAATASVSIQNLQYTPATVTIKPGDSVAWTNNDDRDHTVVAEDGSFASGNLSSGKSFSHTFAKAGTYRYGCKYHPRMKGAVVVKAQ